MTASTHEGGTNLFFGIIFPGNCKKNFKNYTERRVFFPRASRSATENIPTLV